MFPLEKKHMVSICFFPSFKRLSPPGVPCAKRGRAKVARSAGSARPRRVARLLQQEATQPAFCLEETVPREEWSKWRSLGLGRRG